MSVISYVVVFAIGAGIGIYKDKIIAVVKAKFAKAPVPPTN